MFGINFLDLFGIKKIITPVERISVLQKVISDDVTTLSKYIMILKDVHGRFYSFTDLIIFKVKDKRIDFFIGEFQCSQKELHIVQVQVINDKDVELICKSCAMVIGSVEDSYCLSVTLGIEDVFI